MELSYELIAVQQSQLEVGELVVQAAPVARSRLVVVHVLRKGAPREALAPDRPQVGPVGIADEFHVRLSRATAWAARPSPRPVKPSSSVVVARTVTRSMSTPIAPASRAPIATRTSEILGRSPIRTQSALTSSKPSARTTS